MGLHHFSSNIYLLHGLNLTASQNSLRYGVYLGKYDLKAYALYNINPLLRITKSGSFGIDQYSNPWYQATEQTVHFG
jgi:hypothetical protein